MRVTRTSDAASRCRPGCWRHATIAAREPRQSALPLGSARPTRWRDGALRRRRPPRDAAALPRGSASATAAAARRPCAPLRPAGWSSAGDVDHAERLDAVEVARDGAAHAFQARLVVARQALVGLLERGHQRLGAAGDGALLQGHADRASTSATHVLVARARQRLDQLFELRALHRGLGHARFEQRQPWPPLARQILRAAGQHARFGGLAPAVGLAAHEFLFEALDALLRVPGQRQRRPARQQQRRRQSQRPAASAALRRLRRAAPTAGGAASLAAGGVQGGGDCRQRLDLRQRWRCTASSVGGASTPGRSRARARAPRCAGATPARARRASRRRAPVAARLPTASELLKATTGARRLGERRVEQRALGGVELRRAAPVGRDEVHLRRRRARSCAANQSRPPSPRTTSTSRPVHRSPRNCAHSASESNWLRIGGRRHAQRGRHAGQLQRLQVPGPVAPARVPAGQPRAASRPAARQRMLTAFGLTNITSA